MPEFDFNTEIPLGQTRDLLAEQKPSAASSLLSDAYGWAMDNKLAAAAAVGVAALGGYALFRGGLGRLMPWELVSDLQRKKRRHWAAEC